MMKRIALAISIIPMIVLVPAASASAALHSGHIRFTEPATPPTIGEPGLPGDRRAEYEREDVARYDSSKGLLTIEVEVWDAPFWGETLLAPNVFLRGVQAVTFDLGATCNTTSLESSIVATSRVTAVPPEPVEGEPSRETEGSPEQGGVTGEASLSGYEGVLRGPGSFNGQRFAAAFSSPAFRGQNWRCVSLSEGFSFKLGGWPKPRRNGKQPDRPGHRGSR
jgi:hypothetical protein